VEAQLLQLHHASTNAGVDIRSRKQKGHLRNQMGRINRGHPLLVPAVSG
jgi:hypothetical protein